IPRVGTPAVDSRGRAAAGSFPPPGAAGSNADCPRRRYGPIPGLRPLARRCTRAVVSVAHAGAGGSARNRRRFVALHRPPAVGAVAALEGLRRRRQSGGDVRVGYLAFGAGGGATVEPARPRGRSEVQVARDADPGFERPLFGLDRWAAGVGKTVARPGWPRTG